MTNLREQLRRQLSFVISSCNAYDTGHREEAIRIGTSARVLFHDTKQSRSLICTLLAKPSVRIRSTCSDVTRPDGHSLDFIGIEPSSGGFRPYLDEVERDEQVDFATWWTREPIMRLFRGAETITRKQLVLAAANKDGGAHVDVNTPSEYDRLESGVGMKVGVRFSTGEERLVILGFANLAALRQIGHEILTSPDITALLEPS